MWRILTVFYQMEQMQHSVHSPYALEELLM